MKKALFLSILLSASLLQAAALNEAAPKFALTNTHHVKRALSDYRGKVVFINFWASWCAPCQQELPELNRLAVEYKGKKVQIVAINVDEDPSTAKNLITKLGLGTSRIEILLDTKSKVVSTYNIDSMPSSFIVDPNGIIRFTHVGYRAEDPPMWRHEIDSLIGKKD